jgi:hypothetical protein
MKKLIIALVATASIASADITVNLFTAYGFLDNDNADAVLLNTGETALIQLINAGANGTADAVSAAGGGMFGDDVLIGSVSITATATGAADYTGYAVLSGTTFEEAGTAGADVFARIYQDSTASVGSLYYDGFILAAPDVDLDGSPTPTATPYNFGGNDGVETADFATVIPEPATIGLMGIAAAGLFTARRKVRV